MVWAAKWPSITGIWISIRISVYSPGFDCITFSTAIRPFSAISTSKPASSSSSCSISRFSSLSSTSKILGCLDRLPGSHKARPVCGSACSCMRRLRLTVKRLPWPTVLCTCMVPPIKSTMLFVMVRPRPMPCTLLKVVFFCRSNGSKMWFKNSALIPMPLSSTII